MKLLSNRLEKLLAEVAYDPYRTSDFYLLMEAVSFVRRVESSENRKIVLRNFEDDRWAEFDRGIDFPLESVGKRVAIVLIDEDIQ